MRAILMADLLPTPTVNFLEEEVRKLVRAWKSFWK